MVSYTLGHVLKQLSKQLSQQRPTQVHTLVTKVIPIIQLSSAQHGRTQPIRHVPQIIRLSALESFRRRDVRQERHLQHIKRGALTLRHGPAFHLTSSADKVQSGVPGLDVECLFDGGLQHFEQEVIIVSETNVVEDVSVRNDTKRAEDNDDGDVCFDIG